MSEIFSEFFQWMEGLSPLLIYLGILIIAYGENVLPPIPGDMIVVFGGYLAGIGKLNFMMVVLISTIGGALGFMTMYAIGYLIGDAVMDPDRLRWLPKDQIGKARRWLGKWGYGLVAANRFLSGLRSVISITVGMSHMRAWKTAFYATLSALLWTALIAWAGYAVGENWERIGGYLSDYGRIVFTVILVALLGRLAYGLWKRKRRPE